MSKADLPVFMRRRTALTATITLALALVAAGLAGAWLVFSGIYNVAADRPHTQFVYSLMEITMRYSVQRQARSIDEKPLHAPGLVQRGAACFRQHCIACHGAPGVSPSAAGLAMQPLPGPLVDVAADWRARELVWITRHGIRMSGMPAWQDRLPDDDIWALAAFMHAMPTLSTPAYAQLARSVQAMACPVLHSEGVAASRTPAPTSGDDLTLRGQEAFKRHACNGCHVIPGVVGSERHVGPPLAGFAQRTLIAGRLPNTTDNLVRWIRDPQAIDPTSAMPSTGVGEADARAMAAYLSSLR